MLDDEAPWAGATRLGQAQPWTTHGTSRRLHGESQGPRVPSAGKPAGQGNGMGASPTLGGVAGLKTTVAEEALVQGLSDSAWPPR
jgi:hypothetical protein